MRRNNRDFFVNTDYFNSISKEQVGGKAWNLFRLVRYNISVPTWVVISTAVFNRFFSSYRKDIDQFIDQIDFSIQANIDQSSKNIKNLILDIKPNEKLITDLNRILDLVFEPDTLFSIRSSVIDEDSHNNSFAGQMDSFLNIRRADIVSKIKEVWASTFSSRALLYRRQKNITFNNISTAVIIQEMVQSKVSGILFTRDAESNTKQCVISAGFGLGEGIVSNQVQTDTYKIGWFSDKIAKDITIKDVQLVFNRENYSGNLYVNIPAHLRYRSVLLDEQIRKLRDIGIKIEKHLGNAQDIEWAIGENDKLYILQARPIIFLKNQDTNSNSRLWDNSNIVESYPGLTLPLTFSFICQGYETAFRDAAQSFVFFKKIIKNDLHIFKNMLGLLQGRVYYNLLNWYKMLSYLPGFKKYKLAWDQMIGITQNTDYPACNISPIIRFFTMIKVILKLFSVRRTAVKFFNQFSFAYKKYKNIDYSKYNEWQLLEIYESLWRDFMPSWYLTLQNDFYAMKYYDWLKNLCQRWDLDKNDNLHNHLLCGQPNIESVEPIRSLLRICKLIHTQSNYRELFNIKDNLLIWQKLLSRQEYKIIYQALQDHIAAFGDRGVEELKLETQTFREKPEDLIRLIKYYNQTGISIEDLGQKEQEICQNAENFVKKKLKNIFKRWGFALVLRQTRQAVANRENMRFARSRLYGIVRRLFYRMACLFVEKGVLSSTSDIYYLTIDEVFGYITGKAETQNLQALVEIRKAEYTQFAKQNLEERLQTDDLPYLNSWQTSQATMDQNKALKGIGCSAGNVTGTAKIIYHPETPIANSNYILVTRSTDPGWVFLMLASKGIIVERGSVLSHTAIIGRELGIPTIVSAKSATNLIPDQIPVTMNGSTGVVIWQ